MEGAPVRAGAGGAEAYPLVMISPILASATLLIGLAAALGLGLGVALFFRLLQKIEGLQAEVDRLRKMQKDGAADIRARLDASAQEMNAVKAEVEPLALVCADVANLKGTVEAAAPTLESLASGHETLQTSLAGLDERIQEVEQRGTAAEAGVESVREEWDRIQAMVDKSERQLAAYADDRTAEEQRLDDLRQAVGSLRGTVEDRIAEQEERLHKLESGPKAQLEAAKLGLDGPAAPEPVVKPAATKPAKGPATRRRPAQSPTEDEDEKGARWIFIVMAILLGVALIAQYVRSQG